jgi:hypothetical protein
MTLKILLSVIFILSFSSCNKNAKTESNQSDDNYKRYISSFVKNYLDEGYYTSYGKILFLKKDENNITIQYFNKINGEEIFIEIITFSILRANIIHEIRGEGYLVQRKISTINNEHIYNELYFTTEEGKWVDGWIVLKNNDYTLKKSTWNNYPSLYNSKVDSSSRDLFFLSTIVDEKILKYTYDFQKQFIGKYVYDSYVLFGIDTDMFNNKYNNEYEKRDINIDIDDNGFLFVEEYNWKTKIVDENQQTMFFGNTPAYGASVHLYFLNGVIIWEVDLDNNDMKYQLIFKKRNGT